jgi:hypothetical protein
MKLCAVLTAKITKKVKKQGLHNPAVLASVASTPSGQKAITNTLEKTSASVNATASIVKGILKTGLFLGVGYYVYKKVFDGFSTLKEDKRYRSSNISTGMAKNKAEAIYNAMYGINITSAGFRAVKQSLTGVNHNGFIKIYNEFSLRKGINPMAKKMNLIQWISDQFSQSELVQLRFLLPNFF